MKIKATRGIRPLKAITISPAVKKTRVSPKKIHDAYAYYTSNGEFDRDIVVDNDDVLTDGYAAYLIAKMLDIETVPVIRVSVSTNTTETPDVSSRSKYEGMTNAELVSLVCNKGGCSASNCNGTRKADCPLFGGHSGSCRKHLTTHSDLRETLIQYLLDEEATTQKARELALRHIKYDNFYGIVGTPTNITDASGKTLCVGDVVEWNDTRHRSGREFISSDGVNDFIMGLRGASTGANNGEFTTSSGYRVTFKKEQSWRDLKPGDRVGDLTVVEA